MEKSSVPESVRSDALFNAIRIPAFFTECEKSFVDRKRRTDFSALSAGMKTERRETISPGGRLLLRRVNNQQICAAFRFRVEADFHFLSLAVRTDRAVVHKPFSGGTHPEHAECESSGRTFKRRAETDVRIRGKIEFRTPQLKVFPIRILQDEASVFHGETFIFKLRIDLRTHQSPDAESGGTEFEIAVDNGIGFS